MLKLGIHVSNLGEKLKKSGARNHSSHPKHLYPKALDDKVKNNQVIVPLA